MDKKRKIAFTAKGPGWDSEMDPRFGRTDFFVIYDEATDSLSYIDNRSISEEAHGAGPKTSQTLFGIDPDILITGNGPGRNAAMALERSRIRIFTGAMNMTIREAYEALLANKLTNFN